MTDQALTLHDQSAALTVGQAANRAAAAWAFLDYRGRKAANA